MDNMKKLIILLVSVVSVCVAQQVITITDGKGHTVTITPPSQYTNIPSPLNTDLLIGVRPGYTNFNLSIGQLRILIGTNSYAFTLTSSNGTWTTSVNNGITNYDFEITNLSGYSYQGVIFSNATLYVTNIPGTTTGAITNVFGGTTNIMIFTNGIRYH